MSRQVHFTHVLTTIIIINLMTTIVGAIILVLNVSWTFLCSSAAHLTSDVSYTSGHKYMAYMSLRNSAVIILLLLLNIHWWLGLWTAAVA